MTASTVVPLHFGSKEVRTIVVAGDPWFVAKDVCKTLEVEWFGSKTLSFLDDDEKGVGKFPTPRGEHEMLIISESGLYTLIIRSNKPPAKAFRKWVTAEVLPASRLTGDLTGFEPLALFDAAEFAEPGWQRRSSATEVRYAPPLQGILQG